MSRRLVAALACRNKSSRLYAKPLQNLDIEQGLTVLEYIILWISKMEAIDEVVLGISEGNDNLVYREFAEQQNLAYILGDDEDVLERLVQCGEKGNATDVFRVTTESPFTYFEAIKSSWEEHVRGNYEFTCLDQVPDGSGFEITKWETLKYAHDHGERKHRSEFCSLYLREHADQFNIQYVDPPNIVKRSDIRLTVDYPEDLVLCRAIYSNFKDKAPYIPIAEIIIYLDQNPHLKKCVEPFVEGIAYYTD
jgi:spore coat polysaccharide biosynthesis protein SpsF